MTRTIVRTNNDGMFYWVVTTGGLEVARSTLNYELKSEALRLARANTRGDDELVDETDFGAQTGKNCRSLCGS